MFSSHLSEAVHSQCVALVSDIVVSSALCVALVSGIAVSSVCVLEENFNFLP